MKPTTQIQWEIVRDALVELGSRDRHHLACADILTLLLNTRVFFTATEYQNEKSDPIAIRCFDIPCSCCQTYKLKGGRKISYSEPARPKDCNHHHIQKEKTTPDDVNHLWVGKKVQKNEEEQRWDAMTPEEQMEESNRVLAFPQKQYTSSYVWAQCMHWFNQTTDPVNTCVCSFLGYE